MNLPETVRAELGDEAVVNRVDLGGDDALYLTPTRTLRYRGEGLLSEESVESVPHDAERIVADVGRRTATLAFGYGPDGERSVALPAEWFDDALGPILDGVLAAAGVTGPDESVVAAFRFSDLTLAITDARLVKHVGEAVWDADHESFEFDAVTDLAFEEGSVATAVVLTVAGRRERFKAPNGAARAVRERLEEAICARHGVARVADLPDAAATSTATGGDASPDPAEEAPTEGVAVAGLGLSPAEGGSNGSSAPLGGADAAGDGDDGADADGIDVEVAALRAAVERQNERLGRQEELLERLIDELRRGR